MDILVSRLLAYQINSQRSYPVDVREILLFQRETTEEEIKAKIDTAKATMHTLFKTLRKVTYG